MRYIQNNTITTEVRVKTQNISSKAGPKLALFYDDIIVAYWEEDSFIFKQLSKEEYDNLKMKGVMLSSVKDNKGGGYIEHSVGVL